MKVDLNLCRKDQGIAEDGNSCLRTPGTCESCPKWAQGWQSADEIFSSPFQRAIDTEGGGE